MRHSLRPNSARAKPPALKHFHLGRPEHKEKPASRPGPRRGLHKERACFRARQRRGRWKAASRQLPMAGLQVTRFLKTEEASTLWAGAGPPGPVPCQPCQSRAISAPVSTPTALGTLSPAQPPAPQGFVSPETEHAPKAAPLRSLPRPQEAAGPPLSRAPCGCTPPSAVLGSPPRAPELQARHLDVDAWANASNGEG